MNGKLDARYPWAYGGPEPAMVTKDATGRLLVDTEVARDVIAPPHTAEVFDPGSFPRTVEWLVCEVKRGKYDALAGSGHSGLLPMAAACYTLGIPMIAVRKNDERPKGSSSMVNGVLPHRPLRYAIVDDFVASGETVARIHHEVSKTFPQATLAGVLLYHMRHEPWTVNTCRADIRNMTNDEAPAESLDIRGGRRTTS